MIFAPGTGTLDSRSCDARDSVPLVYAELLLAERRVSSKLSSQPLTH